MTCVLVIGSSHIGAYKQGYASTPDLYPDTRFDFFGMRGPAFLTGAMTDSHTFVPRFSDDKDRALALEINGAETAKTDGYDHIVMLGYRFGFHHCAGLLENFDILEGIRTGRERLMSETMLKDLISGIIKDAVAKALDQVAQLGKPVTFAVAPYPASSIVARGDSYALARILKLYWGRPDAAWVFDLWVNELGAQMTGHGHHVLFQPDALNDGPFATKPEYALQSADMGGSTLAKTDHRHMNTAYGLAMLREYAENHLGLTPASDDVTTPNKRIA